MEGSAEVSNQKRAKEIDKQFADGLPWFVTGFVLGCLVMYVFKPKK